VNNETKFLMCSIYKARWGLGEEKALCVQRKVDGTNEVRPQGKLRSTVRGGFLLWSGNSKWEILGGKEIIKTRG